MYDRNSISNKEVKIAAGIQLQKAFDESRFKLALKYALGHSIKTLFPIAHPQEEILISVAALNMKPFDLISRHYINFHMQFLVYVPLRLNK